MKKLFDWFSNNGLFFAAVALLAFIPLYPKLPLIDVVQTWAYIRLEDVFVALAVMLLIGLKIRERAIVKTPLNTALIVYFIIAGISLINALIFIFPKFPTQLVPHLTMFHYLRRVEYISVFFLAYEAYRKRPKIGWVIATLSITYLCVLLYGAGQKFFGFPAFLTMNEEFAKGIPLRLPSTARIPSTFGGHYDLGAFLVFTIPIIGSLLFGVKQWFLKVLYALLWIGGLIILLFTASRISFGVYLIGVSAMLFFQKKSLLIIPVIVCSILILNFTSGASERFYKTFRVSNVVVDLSTGKPIGTLDKLEGVSATLQKSESPAEESLPKGSEFINIPSSVGTASSTTKDKVQKVEYLTSEGLKTGSGEMATISGSFLIQKALVYDISITTRLQGQWPRAMEAFKRNILLGSGLSSLSLAADGDYHRMLGETGILGAIAFFGIMAVCFTIFFRSYKNADPLVQAFAIGTFSGLIGLFFNAVLIDVFEASKVAFTLWLVMGFTLSALLLKTPYTVDYFSLMKRIFTHPFIYIFSLILVVFLLWGGALSLYFLGDDFTWTRWAATATGKDVIGYFTNAGGFFYRPIPKLWYFLLFSLFWLKPFSYHLASLVLFSGIVILLYVFLKEKGLSRIISWIAAMGFAVLSIHHENIYWISGQSSLLSSVFLMGSLVLFQKVWKGVGKRLSSVCAIAGTVCLIGSMFSYDGLVAAPLIVFLFSTWFYGKGKKTWLVLLLIPLYLALRTYAGALNPSGDYGYKISTVFVNMFGNGLGYAASVFVGPRALDYIFIIRSTLKEYLVLASIVGFLVVAGGIFFGMRWWKKVSGFRDGCIVLFAAFLSGIMNFGLGNASDRYALVPSLFFVMAIAVWISAWWQGNRHGTFRVLVILCVVGLVGWNVREAKRIEGDWMKASDVAQTSLLAIKREAYPPKDDLTFFFINPPIRYGKAWIFPTGLNDALWHMFRDNLYAVTVVPTIKDAYEFLDYKGTRYVYVFDTYVLKKGLYKVSE